jgi:hypothetical protein
MRVTLANAAQSVALSHHNRTISIWQDCGAVLVFEIHDSGPCLGVQIDTAFDEQPAF